MRALMIDTLLPAIVAQVPRAMLDEHIFIQQDNARPHIRNNNPAWQAALQALGQGKLHIKIIQQPPQSPDLKILDLGFFAAMQKRQWSLPPTNTAVELRNQVAGIFEAMPGNLLERLFITLFGVMNAIADSKGGNNYKLPHFGKSQIIHALDSLPATIPASAAVVPYRP